MSGRPWDFDEARRWANEASTNQAAVEGEVRDAARAFAVADEAYRVGLARKIVELRAGNVSATLAKDLARGDAAIAALKRDAAIAEGAYEAAKQAGWRRAADRRDTERFIDWSMRRELAEEVGRDAAAWRDVGGFYTAPAILTEYIHCFMATGLTPATGEHHADEDELIEVVPWPLADLAGLIDQVHDAKSLIGLLRLERELRS